MNDLFGHAIATYESGEPCVLCTVVRLDGSGYGQPGARLFLSESGERHGYISGGCLEKDLCRRVWDATAAGPKLIAFDTRGNSVEPSQYNTGCEGVVYVLCQRIDDRQASVVRRILNANTKEHEIRLLTVYRSESKYADIGDTLTCEMDYASQPSDAIGRLGQHSQVADTFFDKLRSADRNHSFAWQDSHGDVIEAAIEIISPSRRLVIFGSGDDVIPVSTACLALGWRVTIVGHRAELTQQQRFPGAEVLYGPLHKIAEELLVRGIHFSDRADVVIMTHDFDRDVELMDVLVDSPVRSIGLLGPKRRLGRLVTRLYQRGRKLSDSDIDRIRSPIGLDIGAISPAEIAASIVAELIALSRKRRGGFLHLRRHPIHEPSDQKSFSIERVLEYGPEVALR
jgi:xanthine dehydrogenase accessory factor